MFRKISTLNHRLHRWTVALAGALAFVGLGLSADEIHFVQAKNTDQHGDPLPPGAKVRMGTLRWRHAMDVGFLAFTPDGKHVVSAGADQVFHVWDRETGKHLRQLDTADAVTKKKKNAAAIIRYNYRGMSRIAMSHDGKVVASVLNNTAIHLFDLQTGNELRQLKSGVGLVTSLEFSPDGKMLAARSSNRVTYLMDTANGKVLHQIKGRPQKGGVRIVGGQGNNTSVGMAFSHDGKVLASAELDYANQKINTYIKFTDTLTGKELRMIDGTPNGVFGVAYSPDGKTFAYGNFNSINICAADTLNKTQTIKVGQGVSGLIFSPDSKLVAAKGRDNIVRLFDVQTGKELQALGEAPAPVAGLNAGGFVAFNYYGADTRDFAFSADSKVIALGSGQTVRFFTVATGKEQPIGGGHRGAVSAITVTPDGKTMFSRGQDGVIRRWDANTGAALGQFQEPRGTTGAIFSPDGKTVALANTDGSIRLHASADGKELHKVKGHQNGVGALAFSDDGKSLASRGSIDGTIRVCDVAKGTDLTQITLPGANPNGAGGAVFIRAGYAGAGAQLAFSPDGQTLATSMAGNNVVIVQGQRQVASSTIHLFNVNNGKEVRQITLPAGRSVLGLAFSPDGRLLATENADQSLSVWELASGRERAVFEGKAAAKKKGNASTTIVGGAFGVVGRGGPLASAALAFSPDGSLLASRDGDNVRVHEVDVAKQIGYFKGHRGSVQSLAFTADGKGLASGSTDTTILVWDIAALKRAPRPQLVALPAAQIDALWADLVGDDAAKAGQSIRALMACKQTPAYFGERLKPAAPPDVKKIEQWIKDLDSSSFKFRAQATQELQKLGELAGPALKKALDAQPAVETRRRIEPLLANLASGALSAEQVRMIRAVEVLEKLGTAEARQVLQTLAKGAPGALQTRKAQEALDALSRR